MSFFETPRFPIDIAYGSAGGPGYNTTVVVSDSGDESRNQNWSEARHRYDAAGALKNKNTLRRLLTFFRMCKGRAHGFRFRDWADYACYGGNPPARYWGVDGTGRAVVISGNNYQMYKRYGSVDGDPDRKIQKPVASTIKVFNAGGAELVLTTDYTLDSTLGIITKVSAETPVTWTGEFDVPCRFDVDQMITNIEDIEAYRWGQIPIVEIRIRT